jgi:hypothetical protein
MKLKLVDVFTVDFTQSEASNIDAVLKAQRLKLGPGECVLLFSMSGRIVYFCRQPGVREIEGETVYASVKFRLKGPDKTVTWWDHLPEFFGWCETCGMDVANLRQRVYATAEALGKAKAPAKVIPRPARPRHAPAPAQLAAVG